MQAANGPGMQITRDLGRLLRRDPALDVESAERLWGAILDGAVDSVEVGAAVAALAVGGEHEAELDGLYRAATARLAPWTPSLRGRAMTVPAYGAMPGEAAWVALIAALLPRFGVPVIVHGVLDSPSGPSAAFVLREMGVLPSASLAEADASLQASGAAFVPVQLLSSAFADLIALRATLGIENSAHVVAQALDITRGMATRITFSHPGTASERLARLDAAAEADAVALEWPLHLSPMQVAARPCIERLHDGSRERLFEADAADGRIGALSLSEAPQAVAEWARRVARGSTPVPIPALNVVAACLYGVGQAGSLAQAKAVAAIQAGRLAA